MNSVYKEFKELFEFADKMSKRDDLVVITIGSFVMGLVLMFLASTKSASRGFVGGVIYFVIWAVVFAPTWSYAFEGRYLKSFEKRKGVSATIVYLATLGIELFWATVRLAIVEIIVTVVVLAGGSMLTLVIGLLAINFGGYVSAATPMNPFQSQIFDIFATLQSSTKPIYSILIIWTLFGTVLYIIGFLYSYAGCILSVLAYNGLLRGGALTAWALGARPLTEDESQRVFPIIERLEEGIETYTRYDVLSFTQIYVVDSLGDDDLSLVGSTLYIPSNEISKSHLAARIALEYAHLYKGNGRLVHALRHFVLPSLGTSFVKQIRNFSTASSGTDSIEPIRLQFTMNYLNDGITALVAIAKGGFGNRALSGFWQGVFQANIFNADGFVAEIGLGAELIAYLETREMREVAVPYLKAWQPPNKMRVEHLKTIMGS